MALLILINELISKKYTFILKARRLLHRTFIS